MSHEVPDSSGVPGERRPESRQDAEAAGPGRPGAGAWRALGAAVVAALAAVSLSCWQAAGGAGPWALVLGLGLRLVCAAAAFLLGTLLALVGRSRRAPPPAFPAAWAARRPPARPACRGPESVPAGRAVISQSLDRALKEVLDYGYRDYVLPWAGGLSRGEGRLYHLLAAAFWDVAEQLRARLSRVDVARVVCADVARALLAHFCDLKVANKAREERPRPFVLHASLRSVAEEARFLQACARVLALCLLPSKYARSLSLRLVLAEVLSTKVLKPVVELLSDPDYINQTLLEHLERREQLEQLEGREQAEALCKRAGTCTPAQEGFLQLINSSSDVRFLQQLRNQIVMEITQVGPQLKRSKGKEAAAKADPPGARSLKRHLAQLTVAKKQCEKRIWLLGGPAEDPPEAGASEQGAPQAAPPLEATLVNTSHRERFRMYMERLDKGALISFWESVEYLKNANKKEIPQRVGEIYQNYFVKSQEISVEKSLYKEIQQCLVGTKGIEVLCKIQGDVCATLKDRYYPSFIASDLYEKLMTKEEQKGASPLASNRDEKGRGGERPQGAEDEGEASSAVKKPRELNEKLEYARQALNSIRNAPKPDKKTASKLKEEIALMRREREDLQRAAGQALSSGNPGAWQASVASGQVSEEDGEQVPCYLVTVRAPALEAAGAQRWTVPRRLSEFQHLHRELSGCFPSLKKVQVPSLSKLPFKSIDQKFLEKSANQLNQFLRTLLSDERLGQSEALNAFLSPSPDYLRVRGKKPTFSLASFLERLPRDFFSHREEEAEEDSDLWDDGDDVDGKPDALAETCFLLIGEIFELRGMFKWVRRTLIALVQVTFGRTINRQIRDTVNWVFSEEMLVYYISVFRDAFWPDGKLAPPTPSRSKEQGRETKERARRKLLDNIPDVLQSLVGQQNARQGIIKIFNALQEARANKHLLHVLLELLLRELCPELRTHLDELKAGRV